jgi:hypothetical protein
MDLDQKFKTLLFHCHKLLSFGSSDDNVPQFLQIKPNSQYAMLLCTGAQLGLFSQANSTLPGVREHDGKENIWTLKMGTNKKTKKITCLQTGDKLQRLVLHTSPA